MDLALDPADLTDGDVRLFVLRPEHVGEHYLSWMNDPQVQRFLESRFARHDGESIRTFVSTCLADPKVLFLGIASGTDGRHVGNIKLGPIDRNHLTADIGLMIGDRSAHGRGIATASIRIMVRIAREKLRLAKLTAGAYASNLGSIRAFQKAGFSIEGRRIAQFASGTGREDLVLLGLVLDRS
jgi:[ribosomal protein S5]-alanine N-acetyltransferase